MFEAVEIFPTEEVGLFTALLNDLKLIEITEGEYVYKAGETAEEVYFIIEGEVSILTENEEKQLAYLKQNDFFGEMSLLDSTAPIRKV